MGKCQESNLNHQVTHLRQLTLPKYINLMAEITIQTYKIQILKHPQGQAFTLRQLGQHQDPPNKGSRLQLQPLIHRCKANTQLRFTKVKWTHSIRVQPPHRLTLFSTITMNSPWTSLPLIRPTIQTPTITILPNNNNSSSISRSTPLPTKLPLFNTKLCSSSSSKTLSRLTLLSSKFKRMRPWTVAITVSEKDLKYTFVTTDGFFKSEFLGWSDQSGQYLANTTYNRY